MIKRVKMTKRKTQNNCCFVNAIFCCLGVCVCVCACVCVFFHIHTNEYVKRVRKRVQAYTRARQYYLNKCMVIPVLGHCHISIHM